MDRVESTTLQRYKHGPLAARHVRQLGARCGEMATDDLSVLGRHAHAVVESFAMQASEVGLLAEAQKVRIAKGWPGVQPCSTIDTTWCGGGCPMPPWESLAWLASPPSHYVRKCHYGLVCMPDTALRIMYR